MGIEFKKFECPPIGENTYFIRDKQTDKCAVIDPGCYTAGIKELINESANLEYIILTHAHWDHLLAINEYLEDYPKVKVIASFYENELLTSAELNHTSGYTEKSFSKEADIYVADGEEIKLGESILKFITTPGHTKGSMCILTDRKLFSGDTLFLRSVGRTDLYGGNWQALKESIQDKLFKLDGSTIVLPGHGPSTTIELEKRENPFV